MENIKAFIEKYTLVPEEDWTRICKVFSRIEFKKNDLILEQGQICRYAWFIESGLLRFFYNLDGEETTKTFVLPPYFFTATISFRNQSPSNENIQVLENTVVWQCSYTQYRELEKIDSWNLFMRKLINEVQEFNEKLMLQTKTRTAEERYKMLLEEYPSSLLQKIPQKHLASFLDIAPQSLSRIKNKIHKKT